MSDAEQIVREASNDTLLKTFAALTHRLHHADREPGYEMKALELRSQRDHVQAEILRRMQ